jgi:hypothetical protein
MKLPAARLVDRNFVELKSRLQVFWGRRMTSPRDETGILTLTYKRDSLFRILLRSFAVWACSHFLSAGDEPGRRSFSIE